MALWFRFFFPLHALAVVFFLPLWISVQPVRQVVSYMNGSVACWVAAGASETGVSWFILLQLIA